MPKGKQSTKSSSYLHNFHFHLMNHLSWHQRQKGNRLHRRTETNHGTNVLWLLKRDAQAIFKNLEVSARSTEPVSRHREQNFFKGSNTTRSFMATSTPSIAKAFGGVIGRTATGWDLAAPVKEEEVKNPTYKTRSHEPHYPSPSKGVDLRATNTKTGHQQHHIRPACTKLLPSPKEPQERPIILTSEVTQKLKEMPRRKNLFPHPQTTFFKAARNITFCKQKQFLALLNTAYKKQKLSFLKPKPNYLYCNN